MKCTGQKCFRNKRIQDTRVQRLQRRGQVGLLFTHRHWIWRPPSGPRRPSGSCGPSLGPIWWESAAPCPWKGVLWWDETASRRHRGPAGSGSTLCPGQSRCASLQDDETKHCVTCGQKVLWYSLISTHMGLLQPKCVEHSWQSSDNQATFACLILYCIIKQCLMGHMEVYL